MDTSDGLVRKPFAVDFRSKEPAALFEVGVELLNVRSRQLVQSDVAQVWNDVLIDAALVGHLGIGPEILLFVGPVP